MTGMRVALLLIVLLMAFGGIVAKVLLHAAAAWVKSNWPLIEEDCVEYGYSTEIWGQIVHFEETTPDWVWISIGWVFLPHVLLTRTAIVCVKILREGEHS